MKQLNAKHHKQAGGTLLGLILGLIVGLGIAVGVALMITKSPIPFVNKVVRPERADPTPAQAADPNRPLYGNRDSNPPQSQTPVPPNTAAAQPVVPAPVAPAKPAETKTADAKPASQAPAKGDAADDKWTYFLQTGAFRDQADAESARAKLALLGFEAKVTERTADSGVLYRVRIGPFEQAETMNRTRSKLSDNGVDAAIVRIPR
ncbi:MULTISPECIES: SPOR domain-containing protein [unclassified Herbaspirillum]|uniref:SPOR domain-containing protein n=1 Tax=unclassified Herbaspirillum TaxID=2624150 RepID=UPI00114FDE41|nr:MULTISPECIES: SPOR domain-containing protein [unclassified Herbaspirillum]MBB5390142.1 cell division protein FtsN [Herbaspirillum sp. SJZ102]TQK09359.1 cell division protein FtsN [Herbaspirillum sp. SJZ130]TQK13954.1 cell division protein FtsN [Herbaspirillum sp. SJZ106]TWC69679.1 cell division protein FtsN [Herbaspirillum sp. SJZ099]